MFRTILAALLAAPVSAFAATYDFLWRADVVLDGQTYTGRVRIDYNSLRSTLN